MKKELLIIGNAAQGVNVAQSFKEHNMDVDVVVVDTIPDNSFELHGARYAPIPKEVEQERGYKTKSKVAAMLAATALVYSPFMDSIYGTGSTYNRKLSSDIDIVKEYGLIMQKKSKLSKWERDTVTRIFEQNFQRV